VERKGLEPSTSALRTQRDGVLSVDTKQVTPTAANGCTNGCTNSPENGNGATLELADATNSKCLELLAANPELRGVIDAWAELPDAVRAGVLAMIRAAGS